MIRAAIIACLLFPLAAEAAPRVSVEGGNVLIEDGGAKKQLTRSGRDSDPVLSPDGRFVVFTREPEKKPADECGDRAQADRLMRIGADGNGEAVLVRGRAGRKPEERLCGFTAKQFSSDGRLIYFLTPGWATSGALHIYDFNARAERFVVDASGLLVLSACRNEHKDRVAIMRHKYFVFGGSYDWYWLYDRRRRRRSARSARSTTRIWRNRLRIGAASRRSPSPTCSPRSSRSFSAPRMSPPVATPAGLRCPR